LTHRLVRSWNPRKGWKYLIEAFLREFGSGAAVHSDADANAGSALHSAQVALYILTRDMDDTYLNTTVRCRDEMERCARIMVL